MTKVKICGLRTVDDAEILNCYIPDYAGVICTDGFQRSVSKEQVRQIRQKLSSNIPLVGVFVNDTNETIIQYVKEGLIQVVQLHGCESNTDIQIIRNACHVEIWKVFRMNQTVMYKDIENCLADEVLLDAGTGSGEQFNWSLTKNVNRRFILAGGLMPDNVLYAIGQTHPYMVDVSSGVETNRKKDPDKIRAFIENVREK